MVPITPSAKRRGAPARRGWSVFVPVAWCHQLVGNFTPGGQLTYEKTHCFDLDGTLAESKASLDAEMAQTATALLEL